MDQTLRTRPIVAIDGPAGAGKSTLAAHLARRFGLINLETGSMYRALALKAIESDLDFDSEVELLTIAQNISIRLEPHREGNHIFLDGMNVTHRLRDADITAAASRVSVHPAIRAIMVAKQQKLGKDGGVVMEGRDIGTAVFPDAEVKIFLDAAPEVRGNRRFRQEIPSDHPNSPITEAGVLAQIAERDDRDRHRADSPLHPAADAVILDSTNLSLEEVLARSEQIVLEHLPTLDKH